MEISHLRYDGLTPPGISAAISLKSFWRPRRHLDRTAFRREFMTELGYSEPHITSAAQVHGADLVKVSRAGHYPKVDGLVTNTSGLILTVLTADCLPLYLWDAKVKAIAVVHAGWRGSASEITKNAIARLVHRFGAQPENIDALLGPCICADCYEIGPEVAAQFHPDDLRTGPDHRIHLDLRAANRRQLMESGVAAEHIIIDQQCTRCQNNRLCSYRAEGTDAGRMISALKID